MNRAVLLVLPLLSLVGGCKTLVRDAETVEYRPGVTPTTVVTKCDATYHLEACDDPHQVYVPRDVPKRTVVGFRHEPDGSLVAVAGNSFTIPPGRYVWRSTPKLTQWDRFAVNTRNNCESVALAFVLPPFILWQVITGGEVP